MLEIDFADAPGASLRAGASRPGRAPHRSPASSDIVRRSCVLGSAVQCDPRRMSRGREDDPAATRWDWAQVLRWCEIETRRVLGAGARADDAAQEAALRAWRRHRQCRTPHGRRAWAAAIARNEALRLIASERQEAPLAEQVEPAGPGDIDATAERLDVRRALAGLDPAERRLIGLRYWADLTQAEAAERLGLPEGTAKVRLHRLRSTLRKQLAEA